MFSSRPHLTLRCSGPLLLITHLGLRIFLPHPSLAPDLILFNLIAGITALVVFYSPAFNDHLARKVIGIAIFLWGIGSFLSTWNSFLNQNVPEIAIDLCYSAFYPLLLFGVIRALTLPARRNSIRGEAIDTLIIGLGISGICAGLALRSAMENFEGSALSVFLTIVYPIGDLILLAVTIALLILQRGTVRSFLLLMGISIFTATDLYFLWQSSTSIYEFASLSDDGWLLGLIFIAESLWHHGGEGEISQRFNSIAAGISLIASSGVLFIAAVRPRYFPDFIIYIASTTILLAFLRLLLALKDARSIAEQRELARTDELTGLPNRRRFLAEIETLHHRAGTLMILDLDGFKNINDLHGHLVGDQLLRTIAHRFARAMPSYSHLARLGGDEFGAIIYGNESVGLESAFALRATLSYPIAIADLTLDAGVSIGRVFHPADVEPIAREELLRRADIAMYQAKRERSGTAIWATPSEVYQP